MNPNSTPARVTLAVIVILTANQLMHSLQSVLPPGESTWLGNFIWGSFWFNFACFIELALVTFGLMTDNWLRQHDRHYTARLKTRSEWDEARYAVGGARASVTRDSAAASAEQVPRSAAPRPGPDEAKAPDSEPRRNRPVLAAATEAADADVEQELIDVSQANPSLERRPSLTEAMRDIFNEVFDADGDGTFTCSDLCHLRTIRRRAKRPLLRLVANFRYLDLRWRLLFPLAYVPFVLVMLSQVEFGRRRDRLVSNGCGHCGAAPCVA